MPRTKTSTEARALIARNLQMLIDEWPMTVAELARLSKLNPRTINYILAKERTPGLDVAERLASAFNNAPASVLLMPNLTVDMVRAINMRALLSNYASSPAGTQRYVYEVTERDAHYKDAASAPSSSPLTPPPPTPSPPSPSPPTSSGKRRTYSVKSTSRKRSDGQR